MFCIRLGHVVLSAPNRKHENKKEKKLKNTVYPCGGTQVVLSLDTLLWLLSTSKCRNVF